MSAVKWYTLRAPFTKAKLYSGPGYNTLSLWVNGEHAGKLNLRSDEVAQVLISIRSNLPGIRVIDSVVYFSEGLTLTDFANAACLVSEEGEITTPHALMVGLKGD